MMRQSAALLSHQKLSIRSVGTLITPDSRHFIPCRENEQTESWYHHWPVSHCGNQLHASETVALCQHGLTHHLPSILVYDALFPAARGATPLLQSLLRHCPDYSEAWGINSGAFSLNTAARLASEFIRPGHCLVYVHDPLRRLSPSPSEQEIVLNILTFSSQNER
ncbi:hypothetical protein [Dickeya poaceiphila]|uniref:Uncharacterized protein n=1 Tax=Dickeya poaceiphila TaxID=568768 RepID=A0A5Q2V569_9GAMM|nr:hypothetical protein [Dickeya poaceiphila]QGH59316.1 hypothetical protein Dpoa569_0003543 [Dickeya poaceiphila]